MKLNIHDLMDNIEDSSVDLEETNVVSSERIKELTKMKIHNDTNMVVTNTRRNWKKTVLTVAIAAAVVTAVGVASFAAIKGGLEGVAFGNNGDDETVVSQDIVEVPVDETGTTNTESTEGINEYEALKSRDMISLQGFSDSPEFKAASEWKTFEDGYDTDWKILDKVGNKATKWDKKYGAYGVYSQDMADKVDQITSKYDLKLHNSKPDSINENKDLDAKFGKVMEDANYCGYIYKDGTFHVDGEYKNYSFQLGRVTKGVFDTVYLNVGSIGNYEQWEYKTASGKSVYLALSDDTAIILADLDDSFVSVNVLLWLGEDGPVSMSKADLEDMADHINFNNL